MSWESIFRERESEWEREAGNVTNPNSSVNPVIYVGISFVFKWEHYTSSLQPNTLLHISTYWNTRFRRHLLFKLIKNWMAKPANTSTSLTQTRFMHYLLVLDFCTCVLTLYFTSIDKTLWENYSLECLMAAVNYSQWGTASIWALLQVMFPLIAEGWHLSVRPYTTKNLTSKTAGYLLNLKSREKNESKPWMRWVERTIS